MKVIDFMITSMIVIVMMMLIIIRMMLLMIMVIIMIMVKIVIMVIDGMKRAMMTIATVPCMNILIMQLMSQCMHLSHDLQNIGFQGRCLMRVRFRVGSVLALLSFFIGNIELVFPRNATSFFL